MAYSRGTILTVSDQEKILELHRQGLSNMEITRRMGKSYPTICKVVKRRCVKHSKITNWTEEELDTLCRLVQKGLSNKEISKLIGRTEWAVRSKRLDKDIWGQSQLGKVEVGKTWSVLFSKAKNTLKIGSKYAVKFLGRSKGRTDVQWLRPLIFEGIQYNWRGDPFFMFRSEAGFRECFTIQQLADVAFDEDKRAIAL